MYSQHARSGSTGFAVGLCFTDVHFSDVVCFSGWDVAACDLGAVVVSLGKLCSFASERFFWLPFWLL